MKIEDILNIIFNELYDSIKQDPYFMRLKDIVLKEAKGNLISFEVQKRIFDKLGDSLKNTVSFSHDSDIILRYALDIPEGILFFTIKYVDNLLFIELKKDLETEITSTVYTKFPALSRIETIRVIKNCGFYEDYECNIYYYDKDFNLVSGASEEEKDLTFSEEFKIPIEFARFFRLNFKKYSKEISRYISSKKMEGLDELLTDKDYCSFLSPFYLDEFGDFINREYSKNVSEAYKVITGDDSIALYNHEFSLIEESLKAQIGTDGEIVISSNIYQNLIYVLLGILADGISIKGNIIKKLNGIYTLYIVNISNNQVVFLPRILNENDLKDIYYANENNQKVEGLAEFFGITRGR
ncbi:MAG: hypothetical protein HFI49_04115 [Bacilli bacterium]|jgi:hypothetical protein|nr:hypothetical protein [Bacilli bacterium]